MPSHRNKGLRAAGEEAARVTAPIRRKRGLAEAALISEWGAIIGPALAAQCVPLRLVRGTDGGTLHIRTGGALALELQHLEPQVIERINGYFGYRAISRIALHQGPIDAGRAKPRRAAMPPSPEDATALAARLDSVADEGLRQALDQLGRGVLARKRRRAQGNRDKR